MAQARRPTRSFLRRIWRFLQRENLHRLLMLLGVILVVSTISITFMEPNVDVLSALWWSIVTMTTVGYGDISPASTGGRVIAVVVMFFGIGLLGMLSATIASVLVEHKIREDRGLTTHRISNHIILCEWNHRSANILRELRRDPKTEETAIALIADIEHVPVDDENLFFVRGTADDATLQSASLATANTVVILGDDRLEPDARDAKVVLATLTVESINPNAYTIVELASQTNVRHCQRAHADEIIVNNNLASGLIARAVVEHGITRVITDLLSNSTGDELYKVAVTPALAGSTFLEAMSTVKREAEGILVAIQRGEDGALISNPPHSLALKPDDLLIIMAANRPNLEPVRDQQA